MKNKIYALLLFVTILSGFVSMSVFAAPAETSLAITSYGTISFISPLHVEGKYIKDNLNQIVFLRGVNKHGFEDFPTGSWQRPEGGVSYNNFDPEIVAANLDAMDSWGINLIRCYSTAEFWIDNTGNHRQIVKDLATMCAARGIYLMYSFWHVREDSPMPVMPYPPYSNVGDELVIASEEDFIDMWQSVASELKDYPNILFELWNEPHGLSGGDWDVAKDSWFGVVRQSVNAIRSTGADNLIVVQWDYSIGVNLDFPKSGSFMDWVEEYPLNDPTGNIVYSTHIYRGDIHHTVPTIEQSWEYDELKLGYENCLVDYVLNTLNKPVIMGEIGPNMWAQGDELTHELAFYSNSLTIFNEWEMNYAGFWWWPIGSYSHLESGPNYQPNQAGDILRNALS